MDYVHPLGSSHLDLSFNLINRKGNVSAASGGPGLDQDSYRWPEQDLSDFRNVDFDSDHQSYASEAE